MNCCPSCGTELKPDGELKFDHESGVITGYGQFACLTKAEMDVVESLRSAWPRTLKKEELVDAMYFHDADAPWPKIIDVFVCKIRKKIDGIGFTIVTKWGNGYQLQYEKGTENE